MKKRLLAVTLTLGLLLAGCGQTGSTASQNAGAVKSAGADQSVEAEPECKVEAETMNVDKGMIPQIIERNVTYVMKDGNWEEESYEIISWGWPEDFNIQDTVWILEADDAKELTAKVDDVFKGKPGTMYIHCGSDLKDASGTAGKTEDGTDKLDITLSLHCDIVFECEGEKAVYENVKVLGAESYMDGSLKMTVDAGGGEKVTINVPADVRKGEWKDFYHAS